MNNDVINIVFISDDHYIMPTCVAITSMIMNKNTDTKYHIYVLLAEVENENKNILENFAQNNNDSFVSIDIIIINDNKYKNIMNSGHVSSAALFKFDIANIFPNLDKVLYLDSDIIILKDLSELFTTDISNFYAGVIKDFIAIQLRKHHLRLGTEYYFNSGVLLLNTKKLREENASEKLLDYKLAQKKGFMDQDAFNYVFNEKVKFLPHKYNYMITNDNYFDRKAINDFYEYDLLDDDINILHITYKKPWDKNTISYNKYYDYFWHYYQYTNWFKNNPMDSFLTIVKQNNNEVTDNLNKEITKINEQINKIDTKISQIDDRINKLHNELVKINKEKSLLRKELSYNQNWIKLFGIYNDEHHIFVYFFGIKLTFKVNEKSINKIAWWIPIRKWRDNFKNKFKIM